MSSFRLNFLFANLKRQFSRCTLSWRRPTTHIVTGKPFSRLEMLTATIMSWVISRHTLAASLVKPDPIKDQSSKISEILQRADELYDRVKFEEMYDLLLQYQDVANDEILWRLARASFEKAKLISSKEEKINILKNAKNYVYKALELNESNFAAHKWASILVVEVAEYEGTKAKIEQSVVAKDHMLKAHALNPQDATTLYLLGTWCFTFADLSWHQRNLAKLLFASPPNSSFEEAQSYFLKAEEEPQESPKCAFHPSYEDKTGYTKIYRAPIVFGVTTARVFLGRNFPKCRTFQTSIEAFTTESPRGGEPITSEEQRCNVQPNFYSMNLLMLGKTYIKLNDKETAIKYLKRARDYLPKTDEDKQAQKDAIVLLKSLGVSD